MNISATGVQLPSWFMMPIAYATWHQQSLFRVPFDAVLPDLRVSADELVRWRRNGWISFELAGVSEVNDCDDPHVWEIIFIRDIVRSGLSDGQIVWLLSRCPRPFTFDPDRIVFSFRYGWVMPAEVEPSEPESPDDIIEENLDAWLEERDAERLAELRMKIDDLLYQLLTEKDEDLE